MGAHKFGFELLEINASDLRSPAQLLPIIKGVASSGDCYFRGSSSSKGSSRNKRPVLLLLDEIDGLAQQTAAAADGDSESARRESVVDCLVRLIQQRDSNNRPVLKR